MPQKRRKRKMGHLPVNVSPIVVTVTVSSRRKRLSGFELEIMLAAKRTENHKKLNNVFTIDSAPRLHVLEFLIKDFTDILISLRDGVGKIENNFFV